MSLDEAPRPASNGLRRSSAYQHCNLINLQMFHSAFKRDSLNLMKECDAKTRLARWFRCSHGESDRMAVASAIEVSRLNNRSTTGKNLGIPFDISSLQKRVKINESTMMGGEVIIFILNLYVVRLGNQSSALK